MTTTVRVSAPDFHNALTAAAVMADDPAEGFDHLAVVYLEAGRGALTVTATDRYAAAHVRVPAEGDGHWAAGIAVDLEQSAALAALTKEMGSRQPVELTMRGDGDSRRLLATGHDHYDRPVWQQVAIAHSRYQRWPARDVRLAYEKTDTLTPDAAPMALRAHLLARLGRVSAVWPDTLVQITTYGQQHPARVDIGDHTAVLLMPGRTGVDRAAKHWPVPYGITPAPEPAAAT